MVYKYQTFKGTIYAEKVINMTKEEGAPGTAIWEASLLKTLRHPNIIALHYIRYDPGQIYLLLEYAVCRDDFNIKLCFIIFYIRRLQRQNLGSSNSK